MTFTISEDREDSVIASGRERCCTMPQGSHNRTDDMCDKNFACADCVILIPMTDGENNARVRHSLLNGPRLAQIPV